MARMGIIGYISFILLIIGGINWGLVGFNFNLVELIPWAWLVKTIYILIGLSGLVGLYNLFR